MSEDYNERVIIEKEKVIEAVKTSKSFFFLAIDENEELNVAGFVMPEHKPLMVCSAIDYTESLRKSIFKN